MYHGARVIEERDGSGALLGSYVYGKYLDEVLTLRRGTTNYFLHSDAQWNTVALTDANGDVVERYEYGDYGQPEFYDAAGDPLTGSTVGNPWLFTGRQWDPELGAYYYRTRYFDPLHGRFLSPDSIGNWGDPLNLGNAYSYTGNNPWSWVDPWGDLAWYPGYDNDVASAQQLVSNAWNSLSPSTQNRLTGTVGVVGGGLEVVGGASLMTLGSPSVVGPVAGTIMTVHGTDTVQASFWQVWTGDRVRMSTAQGITYVTGSELAGDIGDAAIGFVDVGVGGVYLLSKGSRLTRAVDGTTTLCRVRALDRAGGEVATDIPQALHVPGYLGKVEPPTDFPFGSGNFGNEIHVRIADFLRNKYPGVDFRFSVKPGQTGVDVDILDPLHQQLAGFRRAEIKPRSSSGERSFSRQLDNWGYKANQRVARVEKTLSIQCYSIQTARGLTPRLR